MRARGETFRAWEYGLFALVTLLAFALCVCVGSVRVPLADTLRYLGAVVFVGIFYQSRKER